MKYQQFIMEVLKTVKYNFTKKDVVKLQFAYVIYCAFNVSIEESLKIAMQN